MENSESNGTKSTSLKTVISRFTELKKNPDAISSEFEDLDVNKVETALKSVGVQLRDTTGQIRNFDDIIVDLGNKWDGLSRNAQRYVATIAAGSRQQSRLIALLDDFDRTIELMDTAAESEGKADEQFAKYADTMEYKLNQLSTEWEKFKTGIIEEDLFKNSIDSLTRFVAKLNELDFKNPFDLTGIGINITMLITGITKTIALMKSMTTTFSTSSKEIQGKMPELLGTAAGKKAYKKEIAKIKLIPTLDEKELKKELEKLENDLIQKRARYQELLRITPNLSAGERALANYSGDVKSHGSIDAFISSSNLTEQEANNFRVLLNNIKETEAEVNTLSEAFVFFKQKLDETVPSIDAQEREMTELNGDIETEIAKINHLEKTLDSNTLARQRNNQEIEKGALNAEVASQKAKQRTIDLATGGVSLLNSTLSTTLTYIPMIASGMMTASEAAKAWGIQLGTMIITQSASNLLTSLSTVLKNNEKIATEGLTLANIKLAAAEAMAMAPIATGVLIFAAFAAAIASTFYFLDKWEQSLDNVRIAQEKLNEEQDKLKEIQKKSSETKTKQTEAKKDLNNVQNLRKEWVELSQIKNKTTEQQEKEQELIENIIEKYPEIINYHDEINNSLDVSISKWDQIIEKQKEALQEASKENLKTGFIESQQQNKVSQAEINLQAEEDLEYWKKLQSKRTAFISSYIIPNNGTKEDLERLKKDWGFTDDFLKPLKELYNFELETWDDYRNFIYNQDIDKEIQTKIDDINKFYNEKISKASDIYKNTNKQLLKSYAENITDDDALAEVAAQYLKNKIDNNIFDYAATYGTIFEIDNNNQEKIGEYENLTRAGKNLLSTYGIQNQKDLKGLSVEELKAIFDLDIISDTAADDIQNLEKEISQTELETINNVLSGSVEYTEKELNNIKKDFENKGTEQGEALAGVIKDFVNENITAYKDKLKNIYKNFDGNFTSKELESYYIASQNIIDNFNKKIGNTDTTIGERYLQNFGSLADKYSLSINERSALLNSDLYQKYNPLDEEAFRNSLENILTDEEKRTKEEAEKIIDDLSYAAKSSEIIDITLTPEIISSYVEKAVKVQEAFQEAGESLELFNAQGLKTVELSATQLENYEKLRDTLLEIGVSEAENLLTRNASGKWVLNLEKANEIMDQYGAKSIETLKTEKEKADIYIAQHQYQTDMDDETAKRLISEKAMSDELEEQISLLEAATDKANELANAFDYGTKRLAQMSNLTGAVSGALSKFQKNKFLGQSEIASLQSGFSYFGIDANQFINKNLGLTNPETLYKTAIRELQNSIKSGVFGNDQDKITQAKGTIAELYSAWMEYLEDVEDEQEKIKDKEEDIEEAKKKVLEQEEKVREKEEQNEKDRKKALEDIKKAEEDLVKAKEDYVDQLEVIDEKHKAINDEIEKYNELLYGTKNRKGKLDVFYNYEEAISSLSNELSRTTELLGTSEDIDNSVEALQRYTKATSNLIATEKAKQIQIQAGLSNYANMIENGYASYTNKETGQQIGINFGQYAKKDQATGKYILNQRLLNQASFNDEYKNLIEENIETYNKYVDEYEKINDEVLKNEKELQDKRKAALKAYSEIEQNVADALKEQYQKEVDELKNKYDSMKAADDDYLSALEDAINKQRELREREDKYEELAEQEKRLSLLQRDTSGTRQIDANKLKKDVEKTRKQLLDDAVNDVVDSLKKLAQENEETRQVELQLRDAIIENTAHWNGEAQAIVPTLNNADEYANYMAGLNPNYSSMTFAQQQVLIEDYKQQFADALEYQAWNLLDTTAASGDAIVDTINVSTDQILAITTEKTTSFSEEVIRSYNEITEKVSEDLENQEKSIQDARDALQDAVDKLEELSKKIDEAAQKIVDLNEEEVKNNEKRIKELEEEKQKVLDYQEEILKKSKELAKTQAEATGNNLSGLSDVINVENPGSSQSQVSSNSITLDSKYTGNVSDLAGKTLGEMINYYNEGYKDMKNQQERGDSKSANNSAVAIRNRRQEIAKMLGIPENSSVNDINYALKQNGITRQLSAYAKGGLVNFTGPAWVDGTRTAPEAFLSAADTKAIGAAAQILSDLQLIKDYSSLGQSINNTVGDTSIEINLNIDKLSSEIDIDNMITRVKDEIVAVANPVGINTILKQN